MKTLSLNQGVLMAKTYTKRLFLLAVFTLFIFSGAFAQTITVGTVDPGPYGQGSSIAVPISVNDAGSCISQTTNTFNIYLSDASGNFAPGTLIGSYSGFYATFVNGVIPAGTPAGAGYKVEVKSTSPAATSSVSAAFSINASAGVTPTLTSIETVAPNVPGRCVGSTSPYTFFPGPGTVTASFYHEGPVTAGFEASNVSIPAGGYSFTPTLGNYTITTKSVAGGVVGTYDYQLVNNQVVNPFSPFGQPFVCLPPGGGSGILTFDLPASGPGSIAINYPGTVYTVNWGDGTSSSFTYCQIVALGSFLTHTYTLPTCGNTNNALNVTGNALSPYCGAVASAVTTSAKVLITPTVAFNLPATACANTAITVANNSNPGPDYSAGVTSTCASKNPNALYNWYLDGTLVAANEPLSYSYVITAAQATPGTHTLLVHAVAPGGTGAFCQATDVAKTICFEKKPTPAFTIPSPVCITSMPVTVNNTSTVDNTCSTPTYTWTATPATFSFSGGTNKNSIQPKFTFTAAGTYTVTLSIASTCGAQTATQTIVVQPAPTAALSANVSFCGTNQTLTFDATAGSSTKTTLNGIPATDTYAWTVTPALGGAPYSFAGGTSASSQYPQITFTAYDTYTIKVSHTNSCGTITATQQVTFIQPPLLSAGPAQTVCATPAPTVTLAGVASGAISTHLWSSAGGGTFSDVTKLNSTYTPSTAEIAAGSATLTLTATSTSPCNTITSQVVITITPTTQVNSPPTAPLCSGSLLNYTITATQPGSTFTWTAALTSGTATGFTASGSGNQINDALVNTTTSDAVVTYTILPTFNLCPGPPYILKVTVHPLPVITATAPSPVCSNVAGNGTVTLLSNVAGTTYTWTSSASAGITGNTNQATKQLTSTIPSTLANSALTAGTVTYTITPYNGTCAGTPAIVNITVEPTPKTSNPGSDAEICASTTYTLNGNSPAPGTGLWTVSTGPGGTSFSSATSPTATVSGMIPGNTYQFKWTITASPLCPSSSNVVTIIDDKTPIGGTTSSPAEVCSGSNGGLITVAGYFGTISRWESSIDNGTTWQPIVNTGPTQPYLNLTQTTLYRAILHNGVCPDAPSAATTITVDLPPVIASAGPNNEVCASTSYTLQGNNPSPGTGLWTVVTGPAGTSFSNATSPNATVSGMLAGSVYQFKWTITGTGFCPTNSSTVTITDDKSPVGGTTSSDAIVCASGNSGTITLAGQFGTVVRWESSIDNGTTWQPIVNTGGTQTYSNLTQTTKYRAVLHNGVCPDVPSAATTITVLPLPVTSNAGADDEVCASTSYTLQGNNPSPGTGLWTLVSGPVGTSFSNATSPNAIVSGLLPGSTYQFKWTITSSATCPTSSNTVNITIDKSPVGGTTSSPATVCTNSNSGTITLAGQFGTVIRWESSIDNGATWQAISNTGTTQPYLNLTQTTEFRAVLHNGVCPNANSAPTTITVQPLPVTSNPGPDAEICASTSYTLQGNNPSPGTGKWTVVSGPAGSSFSNNTSPTATVSGLLPGNIYQFQWTITGSASCPPSSNVVNITIDKAPVGGTTSTPATVCIGTNGGQVTLAGQFGTITRWESSIDNGANWVAITNTSTIQPYLNLTQTTEYRAIVHNGVCPDVPSAPTTITVVPLPVTSNPGPNDEVCSVTSYTLHGNNPAPGTGKWTVAGPAGVTFSDATNPNAIANGLIPGSVYQFTWTITGSPACPPSSNTVTITIDKAPIGGTTSTDATVCISGNAGQITLSGQFGTIVRWESSVNNGTTWLPIANTSNTQSYLNLTQTTQYRAILHNSSTCADVPSSVTTITVAPLPIPAIAGANDEVCNVTSYALHGNNPAPGTGKWTVAGPAGVTFSDATNPNAIANGLIPGSIYQFTWTITTSPTCPSTTSTVTITIDKAPVGGVVTANPAEVCFGSNGGTLTLTGQFGTIFRWESSIDNGATWQAISNGTATQTFTNLSQTTEYRAILHNSNTCPDVASAPGIVIVDPLPVASNPGPNDEVCNVTTYNLHGNNPAPGTGRWTITQGPAGATFSDATNPNAIVSGLIPGSVYQFKWTITSSATSVCPPNSNTVNITIDQAPIGGTTSSPAEVCATGNGGQIKLTGQLGSVVRWESSVDNGVTWQPISNTGTTQSYLNLTQTTSYRAILHNGATCSDVNSTATTITVDPPPVDADAGADDEVCSVTSYNLNGNSPAPGTGKWTLVTGPAGVTFSNATNPATTVSGLVPGNVYQFRWTITGSPFCAPSTDIITIKIDKAPIGGTTSAPAEVCSGGNGGQIKLSGQFGSILRWESSIDNGITWQPIVNTSTTQSYLNLTQTTEYRAILHNSTTCSDVASTATTITVDTPPTIANAGTDDEVCNVTTYKLNGNTPAPGSGKWTLVTGPAGVTFSNATDPAAIVNGLIPGNIYQFRWTITGSPFCAPSTDLVTITIDKAPVGGTTSSPAEVCASGNGGQIKLSGQFGSIVRWESSIDNGVTWQPIANTGNTQSYLNLTQTTSYRAILHNGATCPDVNSTATTITVDPPPVDADAGADDEVCSVTTYLLNGNSPGTGTGKWTVVTGPAGATFSNATNPNAIVSGLIPGNVYQFKWSITASAFCPPSTDIVTVTIDKAPIGGTTSAPAEVCSGSNGGQIKLSGQFGTIVRWESSIDNGSTWQPVANTSTTQSYLNITQTTEYRAILHNSTTCSDVASTATTITVDTPPTVANAGAGDEVCNVTTYTLHGNTPAYGTGLWTIVTGPAGVAFSNATNPSAILTGLIPGNVYQFKWTITGTATCPPSSSIVTIAVDLPPIGGTTSSPAEVCAGSNGGQIKLTGQFGNILRWESSINNGVTWQTIANTNNTQSYVNLTQTTQYRAILHNSATCPDVTSTVTTITVDPPPIAADAGIDAEVCSVTTYTLNGNNAGTGTGNWTVVGGPAGTTFSDVTNPKAIVSGLIPGNVYQFQWSITGTAACPPSTDIVTITIDKAPIGGTTSAPAEVCSGSNGGQITLSGQFGTVLRWESSIDNGITWQPIANTNITQLYLNLTRTTQYRAVLHNSTTCADVASTATIITVDAPPVTADAGSDDEVCSVTTYTLNGNNPAPGTGKWSVVGGPAGVTFSDVTNPAAIVSGLIPGSIYQFQWSITGTAACPPSTDIVTITIDKMPIGGTTSSPAEVCYGGNAGQIKLSGQFGSVLRWEFSTDNGTTWQAIANTGTTQPYINLIHTTQYRAILHNSATCSDVASTATTITVDPPPIDADAGPDDEVCSVISYNLHGNNPAPGTGQWTVVSGPAGATFSDATNPLATVSGLIPGNVYQFEWTITGTATCPPSTDIATIRVDKAPIGGTTSSPAEVCSGNNTGQITLTGQFGTIVRWEFSIDNGTTWQPIANTSITLHFADLTQTTQYRAVLQNGTVCADVASTATTITVDPPPVTSIPGPDDVVCNVTVYTLHANNPAPGTGKWTVVQGPAGAIFSDNTNPNATVSGLIPGNIYQFKWAITNTTACPPSSGVVTITIDQAPVGGTTSTAMTVCWGSNAGQILLTGQFGTIVRWESSIDNATTWQPIANSTATQSYSNLTRTTLFRAILHNGTSCPDVPSAPTIITVNPPTPSADAGQDFNICNQTAITLSGNNPGTFSGTWTQTAGPVVNIVNPSNYVTQVTGLSGDNIYTFKWTIFGLPPCGNTSSVINIGLHTDVVPSFTMDKSHGCGPTVVTFTNTTTPSPVGVFIWNFGDGSPTISAITPPPHTYEPSSDGTEKTYTITMTPASNCGSQAPFVDKITVSPQAPVAAILPVQTNACGTFTVTARNLSPGNNVKYDFYLVDENNAIVQHLSYPDVEDAIFQPIVPTKPTIYTVYMIATDQCGNQSRTVPVNISASPSLVVSAVQIKGDVNSVCLGSPVTFQNISTGGDKSTIIVYDSNKNPLVTIPGGTGDTEYIPPATGTYYVSITAGNEGCGDAPVSALKEFFVYPVPKPSFTYTIDDQYNVTFTNTTPNAENIPASSLLYSWDFGDGSVKENIYEPSLHHFDFTKSPFTVALTATTPGTTCAGITTQVIDIKFHGNLFLPNAFIPTSSKKDLQVFTAKGFGLKTWHMQIFNNFGQLIWESTKLDSNGSPTEGWDGTYKGVLVEQGVYVWQISATLLNGQEWKGMSFGNAPPRAVGVIHLIR